MKVGIDAVLIGAWCDPSGERALDVGTGCGVIALILAQRNPEIKIDAIDPDHDSVVEASENFRLSYWKERLNCKEFSFAEVLENGKIEYYDNIVSNPPFFNSGIKEIDNARLRARHQKSLSLKNLIEGSSQLLKPEGRLSFIFPTALIEEIEKTVTGINDMTIKRICHVEMRNGDKPKRTMIEIKKTKKNENVEETLLRLFNEKREPTTEYLQLCKDFYLKF